jgi:hypothetical protein
MASTPLREHVAQRKLIWVGPLTIVSTVIVNLIIRTIASTSAILMNNPSYMHNWRGITCIVLTVLALLIYAVQYRMSLKMDWPLILRYAVGLGVSLYLVVMLLTLINTSFVWDFYVVFAISFGLFGGVRLLLAVSSMALTMFAFQGLLVWPPTSGALVGIASQVLTLFSITGFNMLFQHLIGERFERNKLFTQLTQANGELEEAHRQLAQSVVQEQELAVLRERTRLAREMHDTIGHALVLIFVKLEAAQRLRERDPERCDHELESTKQIARETMTALRTSIQGHLQDRDLRTIQRRFLRATGLTQNAARQIERARYATSLLQQGVSILDTVLEAGYFDQPHPARSLKFLIGQTPAQILQKSRPERCRFYTRQRPLNES